jgi:hypothetical protein
MQNGYMTLSEFLRLYAQWIWRRVAADGADDCLRGPHEDAARRTGPEAWRVGSRQIPVEIVATLDGWMRNRGLGLCHEMMRCCGGEAGSAIASIA